jgi:hypothetical protein
LTPNWIENEDGSSRCVACGCASFSPGTGSFCNCKPGASEDIASESRTPVVTSSGASGHRLPLTADDYERELYDLGREDRAVAEALRRCRAAATRMYWGPEDDDSDSIAVVGDDSADVSPRKSYECHRDSIRLRLMALDSATKFLAERRKRLEILYRMALKRDVMDAVHKDHDTAIILKGGKPAQRQARDAN